MIVEPGKDLGVGAVGESVVGEIRLPGLVGLVGLESNAGGFRAFGRLADAEPTIASAYWYPDLTGEE